MRSFAEKFDDSTRSLGPGVVTFLLLLLSVVSSKIAGLAHFFPLTTVMAIYYWALFRPRLLPYWFVALMGLVQDAVTGLPLGISSLIYIVFRSITLSQRKIFVREAFWAMWVGFVILSVPVTAAYWVAISLYHDQLMPFLEGMFQWMLTAAIYPLVHVLFNKIYIMLPKD